MSVRARQGLSSREYTATRVAVTLTRIEWICRVEKGEPRMDTGGPFLNSIG